MKPVPGTPSTNKISGEKRKAEENVPKSSKKSKKFHNKVNPPTAEEINRLRETENVFHSNLFRLQIEETLKEVTIKEATGNKIASLVESIMEFLRSAEVSVCLKLSKGDVFDLHSIVPPMKSNPNCVDTVFTFMKPKSVDIIGSFNLECVVKGFTNIDIGVVMPKAMFLKEDYLNEKYLRKKNYYLCCLASKLHESAEKLSVDPNIQFTMRNCRDKPLILINPATKKLKKFNILIHCFPEMGTFKETRFSPAYNNVRYGWYFNSALKNDNAVKLNFPTPYYNSLICQDLVSLKNEEIRLEMFNSNQNLKDALILLKIWLHQRRLDVGPICFSGYLMSMFIVYLMKNKKLNRHMSSYQIIRNVWVALDQSNWHINGISLFDFTDETRHFFESFQQAYDVVFIDATGNANVASSLDLNIYLLVKSESKYAVECLDNQAANFYAALFMTPLSLPQYCDQILCFKNSSVIEKTVEKHSDLQVRLDLRQDSLIQFSKIITNLLKKALGDRIIQIFPFFASDSSSWSIFQPMPRSGGVSFGIRINPEFALNIIDKGPVANLPEAEEFRKFWGEKSELRRFKDGNVCETVPWASSTDSLKQKRSIVRNVVKYIMKKTLQIEDQLYIYVLDQVEDAVYDSLKDIFEIKGTIEEITLNVLSSFDNLSKQLRELDDEIPLPITSIQGTSPVFRYSDPFPVLPNATTTLKKAQTCVNDVSIFDENQVVKYIPYYVPVLEGTIHFALSNKWPEDLGAIRSLQTAFYIKLSGIIKQKFGFVSVPYNTHLDVLKDGFIFRLQISNNNEITAVKRLVNDEGLIEYRDNEESWYLEKKVIQLPTLNSAIHGLHQQFPAFGTTCTISKRWLRCHLIDDHHFPDICVDLLVSYLFLYPQPYFTAHQPQTMFIRFLNLLSSGNWHIEPVVVNFNNELSREDIVEIDSFFNLNRSSLPALFIVTPFDKSGITWTKEEPSLIILNRVAKLANAALRSLEASLFLNNSCESILKIFRPPLKGYDLLIWTKHEINPLRWLTIGADKNSLPPIKTSPEYDQLPILDFHPVKLFVNELRENYREFCIFLYDFYGGNVIGAVLKPDVHLPKEFKVSNMKCRKLVDGKLVFDIDALIDDFYIQGKGIVSHIEKNNENK
ncbi:nucleolar protein 6 [Planococcus citri]|uniref:nucleolar protein 6 n=1 Tax=Planococcus citri TaxID=170843 RepID=UPI0031F82C25